MNNYFINILEGTDKEANKGFMTENSKYGRFDPKFVKWKNLYLGLYFSYIIQCNKIFYGTILLFLGMIQDLPYSEKNVDYVWHSFGPNQLSMTQILRVNFL